MATKMTMTQEGFDEKQKHLQYLRTIKRNEIIERIKDARSQGDLSENAEYSAAREEQENNEREIAELEAILKNATIMNTPVGTDVVAFGSTVTIYDDVMQLEEVYTLKGSTEADTRNNIISIDSPLGLALSGKKVGDSVTVNTPNGGSYTVVIRKIQ